MCSFDEKIVDALMPVCKKDGVIFQELLRARIIPEWMQGYRRATLAYRKGFKAGKQSVQNGSSRKLPNP